MSCQPGGNWAIRTYRCLFLRIGGRAERLEGPHEDPRCVGQSQYQGSATALQKASLAYLAVILLVISLVTNISAQVIARRIQRRAGGRPA